ncbi:MAG: serine/threonine protein kinase [Candidatus Obscuribacter sp.]|nr:serine/threonine protein kinase [Candidatus Obscuribacter sp.]MBP6348176.1 serine/threonine protein kinase [Candidatus Obscuribacter sp.]MBP6594466.1 serine/threonine protein kinase [Candidatus Obscuribacter sp.]MBP7575370.1 serine/threonine protein kinase [Candidatus Obscuribacter sp.]
MKYCPKCQKKFETLWAKCPDDGAELETDKTEQMIGQIFADQYEILSVLGAGGMSVVYRAKHRLMDRIVAIKLLHDDSDKQAIERFKHEAKSSSSLKHQNIISIYDFGIVGNQAYLVMDCLEGKNLSEILEKEERLSVDRAINIFRQTCHGLEHAHKNGILHRDLKPSNLVIIKGEDGTELVKIVDFGIAKLMPNAAMQQTRLTQTGDIFGSPLYMSPEQCQARPLDSRSDIYSLGCLMYEALTGVAPLRGETAYDTMTMHVSTLPAAFGTVAPELKIDKSIEAMVFRCLEKKPEDRYQTIAELLTDMPTVHSDSGSVKVKAVMHPTRQKREIKYLRYSFWSLFVICAAIALYATIDNGADFDHGTLLEKTLWNCKTTVAQTLINNKLYDPARALLLSAEESARQRFSNKSRVLTALRLQRELYIKARMFEDLEAVNSKIAAVNSQMLLESYNGLMAELSELAKPASQTQTNINKLLAPISFGSVNHIARGLAGNSLDKHAETLLTRAKQTYTTLLGPKDLLVADVDMLLGEAYWSQQRLKEVRPVLVEALEIYDSANLKNDKRKILAMLKLGQLDRDENRYDKAKDELETAMEETETGFGKDKNLLYQCLNSYGSYLESIGKSDEATAVFERAQKISPEEVMQETVDHNSGSASNSDTKPL